MALNFFEILELFIIDYLKKTILENWINTLDLISLGNLIIKFQFRNKKLIRFYFCWNRVMYANKRIKSK